MENLEINGEIVGVNPGTFQPEPLDSIEPDTEFRRQQELLSTIDEKSDKEINGLSEVCEGEENEESLELAIGDQVILRPNNCFDGDTLPFGWECSDYSIVNINPTQSTSQALIMAMKEGEAEVKATSVYPDLCKGEYKWNVVVKASLDENGEGEKEPGEQEPQPTPEEVKEEIVKGGTVSVNAPLEVTETLTPTENLNLKVEANITTTKDVDFIKLDNGKKVEVSGEATIESPYNGGKDTGAGVFNVTNGELVVESGKIVGPRCVTANGTNSNVTINGGDFATFYGNNPTVFVGSNGGKVEINGGEFKVEFEGTIYNSTKFLLNLNDDLLKGTNKKATDFIEVKGGTFYHYDPSHSKSENPEVDFVPSGYIVGHYEKDGITKYVVEKYNNHPDMDIDGPEDSVITWDIDGYKKRSGIVEVDADKEDKSKEGETKPDLEL